MTLHTDPVHMIGLICGLLSLVVLGFSLSSKRRR